MQNITDILSADCGRRAEISDFMLIGRPLHQAYINTLGPQTVAAYAADGTEITLPHTYRDVLQPIDRKTKRFTQIEKRCFGSLLILIRGGDKGF